MAIPQSVSGRYAQHVSRPVERLLEANRGEWKLDACGVTRTSRPILALLHRDAYNLSSSRARVLVVGGLSGRAGDVDLAVRVLAAVADEISRAPDAQGRPAVSAIPCANPDGVATGLGPENGAGGNPVAGYPPGNNYFNDARDPETRYLWRWIGYQAPDLVVELREGDSPYWEANSAATEIGRRLGAATLEPAGSLLHALGETRGPLGPIPALRLTSSPRSGPDASTPLWRLLTGSPAAARSPAAAALAHRRVRPAIDTARLLADSYGRRLDSFVYTQGVGISGRLRLHELGLQVGWPGKEPAETPPTAVLRQDVVSEAESEIEPWISGAKRPFKDGAGGQDLAGVVWAEELARLTGRQRYRDLLLEAANRYSEGSVGSSGKPPPPADPDFRTEDMFFTSAVLGRAFQLSGDYRYVDLLAPYLRAVASKQQANGLYWHCDSAPFFWGRGNGFAAIGFAEALTYLPATHPVRPDLLESHRRQLDAMAATMAPSDMLRQVLDFNGSYEELSATCMLGYAMARGIRLGWLDRAAYLPTLDRLWAAVAIRIDERGGLVDVCTGTGVQPDLRSYLDRPAISGFDDRGGSLALWFAVEMTACILSAT